MRERTRPQARAYAAGRAGSLVVGVLLAVPFGKLAAEPSAPAGQDGAAAAVLMQQQRPTPRERARRLAEQRQWDAAIRAYDELWRASPNDRDLAIERARVLAWSEDYERAAAALGPAIQGSSDPELHLDHARYLWWSGQPLAADGALDQVLRLDPAHRDAHALRTTVRQAADPDVETARLWLRDDPGPASQLILARTLVRAGRLAESLGHYRAVLGTEIATDSLYLEAAAAAQSADSLLDAVDFLGGYLELHPEDRSIRVQRARLFTWSGDYDRAAAGYTELLRERDDPALRFERARIYAWSGREGDAEQDLLRVVRDEPNHAPALKLLGDLASWRSEWDRAIGFYERAIVADPDLEGIDKALAAARAGRDRMIVAAGGPAREQLFVVSPWLGDAETFVDSEEFRWLSAEAARRWESDPWSFRLKVRQDYVDGLAAPQFDPSTGGTGAGIELGRALADDLTAEAGAGVMRYYDVDWFATWLGRLRLERESGLRARLEYARQPAVRRAATAASLEAEATSDLVQLAAALPLGSSWYLWSQGEVERFDSGLGGMTRLGGALALSRPVGGHLTASVTVSALTATDDSPVLEGWSPLFWSPELYVEPRLGIAYLNVTSRWQVRTGVKAGAAFVDERTEGQRRFDGQDVIPTAELTADVGFRWERWLLRATGNAGGAVAGDGYRAFGLQISAAYLAGER